jgi:hypothetical protein
MELRGDGRNPRPLPGELAGRTLNAALDAFQIPYSALEREHEDAIMAAAEAARRLDAAGVAPLARAAS